MTSSKQFYSRARGRFSDQQMGSFYQRFNLFWVDIRSVSISGLRLVCACFRLVHVVICFVALRCPASGSTLFPVSHQLILKDILCLKLVPWCSGFLCLRFYPV